MLVDNAHFSEVFVGLQHIGGAALYDPVGMSKSLEDGFDFQALPVELPLRARALAAVAKLQGPGREHDARAIIEAHRRAVLDLRANLYLQGRLKRLLRARHSQASTAALITAALEGGVSPVLGRRRLQGMRDYLRASGEEYIEFESPSVYRIVPPPVYGAAVAPDQWAFGRSLYVGAVRYATVRHRSSLVHVDEVLLVDAQDDELRDIEVLFEVDPCVLERDQADLVTFEQTAGATIELDEAVHLGGVASRAFGHWMIQFLPKLFAARERGLPRGVPILIDSGMPDSHREALSYFLDDDTPVFEIAPMGCARVAKLWVVADRIYVPICPAPGQDLGVRRLSCPPDETAAVVRAMIARKPGSEQTGGKLFMARRPTRHRKMTNQDRIMEIATELGFRIVYLEDHPFAVQIGLIRSSSTIIGPDGSSHLLCLFARPGTKISMLTHGFMENNASMFAIFSALQLDTMILQGRCTHEDADYRRFSDYVIDEDDFRKIAAR